MFEALLAKALETVVDETIEPATCFYMSQYIADDGLKIGASIDSDAIFPIEIANMGRMHRSQIRSNDKLKNGLTKPTFKELKPINFDLPMIVEQSDGTYSISLTNTGSSIEMTTTWTGIQNPIFDYAFGIRVRNAGAVVHGSCDVEKCFTEKDDNKYTLSADIPLGDYSISFKIEVVQNDNVVVTSVTPTFTDPDQGTHLGLNGHTEIVLCSNKSSYLCVLFYQGYDREGGEFGDAFLNNPFVYILDEKPDLILKGSIDTVDAALNPTFQLLPVDREKILFMGKYTMNEAGGADGTPFMTNGVEFDTSTLDSDNGVFGTVVRTQTLDSAEDAIETFEEIVDSY